MIPFFFVSPYVPGVVQERKRPIENNDSGGDETKIRNDCAFEHCPKPTKESSLTPLKRSAALSLSKCFLVTS
jgi:hypothetical protein